MAQISLSEEEIMWGQIYVWIHKRAEYLRSKQMAESGAVCEAGPDSAEVALTERSTPEQLTTNQEKEKPAAATAG